MIINNIGVIQQKGSQYLLYLPNNICVGHLAMPSDNQYIEDAKVLQDITKSIAVRWNVYEKKKGKGHKE